ncbi:MAG: tRNA (adenosine(37)-N6)-threonylcarbamoyltransferase complex ATPase subunit type 1 TsaE [Bdellovibrionales bacterium]
MNVIIKNLSELESWVTSNLILEIDNSCLILLEGPLGAGKTQIVKSVAQIFGSAQIQSPTFSFHNQYKTNRGFTLHHVDLYRLKSEEDLESIGFWDLLHQESGPFFIEWSNLLDFQVWPKNKKIIHIKIKKENENVRSIDWTVS